MDGNMIKLAVIAVIAVVLFRMLRPAPAHVTTVSMPTTDTEEPYMEYEGYTPAGVDTNLIGTTPAYTPDPAVLTGKNFLDARRWTSINTVGNSLKNSSYDIRSAPPVPKNPVGPWQQSDIQPDLFRRPLE